MKALKTLLLVILGLAIVAIAGIAAFVATLNPNDYKDQLIAHLKADTGRSLTLDGPIELGLWPKLRLRAGPLALGNAAGFSNEPMLTATEVQVAVATGPLLSRRVEMDTVVLHGVTVNLERNAAGVGNWEDLAGKRHDREPTKRSGGGEFAALILGGVDIQDARLRWHDAVSGQRLSLDKVTASTGALTFGKPIDLKISATVTANQPALDADIEVSGTLNYDVDNQHYVLTPLALVTTLRGAQVPGGNAKITLDAGFDLDLAAATATLSGLKLAGLGTRVTGEFAARDLQAKTPSASGSLIIKGTDLAQVFNAFALPVGKQLGAVADRSFAFDTAFDADMDAGVVKVSKLEGRLLGAELKGGFAASKANTDTPLATGNLQAHGPDLPMLVAVLMQLQGANAQTLKQLNQALAGSRDKSFDVNAELDVDLGAGKAALPKLDAKLLGNTLSGRLSATNAASRKPALKGELKASGADFPGLLAVVAGVQGPDSPLAGIAQSLASEANKSFSFATEFDADLGQGRLALPKLVADVAGLKLRASLTGEDMAIDQQQGKLDGKLNVESAELGPLLRAFGQGDMARSIKSLKVETGVQGGLQSLNLSPLTIVVRVARPELEQSVDLSMTAASAHADLKAETASVKALTVTGLGLHAKADIEAEKIMSKPSYTGSLSVPTFNLRSLLKALNKPVPQTADPEVLEQLALNARFSGTMTGIKLAELAVTLDDSHLKGDIDVAEFKGPNLAFSLKLDGIDADRYLEPPAKGVHQTVVTPDAAVAGAANALPVEKLRALKVKGSLTVDSLILSGAKMKNVRFSIDASKGLIKLAPLAALLYDGSYGGAVHLDARGPQAELALETKLDKVNISPLLQDTVHNESLSGVMSFDAALKAEGGDARHVEHTLGGRGRFGIGNGVFRGVDAVAILRAVEQIIECKCAVAVPKGGQTPFKNLDGTLAIKSGVIRNEDLVMNGEGFTITGKGMLVNLNDNSIKYDLKLAVTEQRIKSATDTYKLGGYEVPIACRGQLDSPSCLPDFGNILGEVAKAAATKKIEKALGKKLKGALGGKNGDALKNLLKF